MPKTRLAAVILVALAFMSQGMVGAAAAQTARDNPVPVGDSSSVDDYEVTVISVTPNAADIVAAEDQLNLPPDVGQQFFLARISVTYHGTGIGAPGADLNFIAVGASSLGYSSLGNTCGTIPDNAVSVADLSRGASVEFNICWAIDSDDASSLVMQVESLYSFDEEPVWFSLGNTAAPSVATPAVPVAAVETSSRENPVPLGTPAVVGDFIVTVVSTTPDAAAAIADETSSNDPPAPGEQFYLMTVSVTYTGTESVAAWLALRFRAVGDTGIEYTFVDNSCGIVPDDGSSVPEMFPSATVEYNVCWAIDSADAASLLMYVQPPSNVDADPVWFSLRP